MLASYSSRYLNRLLFTQLMKLAKFELIFDFNIDIFSNNAASDAIKITDAPMQNAIKSIVMYQSRDESSPMSHRL